MLCFTHWLPIWKSWHFETSSQTSRAVSRTTAPILSLFVLIWTHFLCLIQIWKWKFDFSKIFEKLGKFWSASCTQHLHGDVKRHKCHGLLLTTWVNYLVVLLFQSNLDIAIVYKWAYCEGTFYLQQEKQVCVFHYSNVVLCGRHHWKLNMLLDITNKLDLDNNRPDPNIVKTINKRWIKHWTLWPNYSIHYANDQLKPLASFLIRPVILEL